MSASLSNAMIALTALAALAALGTASACSSSEGPGLLPTGDRSWTPPSRAGEVVSGNLYPCGFEYTEDNVQFAGRSHIHHRAWITYDKARRDMHEEAVDDD